MIAAEYRIKGSNFIEESSTRESSAGTARAAAKLCFTIELCVNMYSSWLCKPAPRQPLGWAGDWAGSDYLKLDYPKITYSVFLDCLKLP